MNAAGSACCRHRRHAEQFTRRRRWRCVPRGAVGSLKCQRVANAAAAIAIRATRQHGKCRPVADMVDHEAGDPAVRESSKSKNPIDITLKAPDAILAAAEQATAYCDEAAIAIQPMPMAMAQSARMPSMVGSPPLRRPAPPAHRSQQSAGVAAVRGQPAVQHEWRRTQARY